MYQAEINYYGNEVARGYLEFVQPVRLCDVEQLLARSMFVTAASGTDMDNYERYTMVIFACAHMTEIYLH